MIISEYTAKRAEKLNIMNFLDMEFPLNLQILWMDLLDVDSIISPVLIGSHSHSFYEIHMVYSGKCVYECNGKEHELAENQALIIPCGSEHKYLECDEDILKTSIAFSCNNNSVFENIKVEKMELSRETIHNIDYILRECDNIDVFTSAIVGGRAFEIIYGFLKMGNARLSLLEEKSVDPRFVIAKQFIEKNLQRQISIEDVAKECCLSSKQLNRIFKSQTNSSLYDYIVKSKIRKAEKLISQREKSIKEIGYSLGFENECSFITFFKRHKGLTPGAYRNNKTSRKV